jgi:hypothetical protein
MCTMQRARHESHMPKDTRGYRRELQYLYARRSAIDAVILSLQNYDRHRKPRRQTEETLKRA